MQIVISLLGGLGLFLYGMNLMGESLEKVAGSKMKKIIELLTKIIFMGVILGAVVTAVIQSSSATTVMVVGFVNAGLMDLPPLILQLYYFLFLIQFAAQFLTLIYFLS